MLNVKRMGTLVLLVWMLFAGEVVGQGEVDMVLMNKEIAQAQEYLSKEDYAKAVVIYEKYLPVYQDFSQKDKQYKASFIRAKKLLTLFLIFRQCNATMAKKPISIKNITYP